MTTIDIIFSDMTRLMLEANGRMDAEHGMSHYDGWRECAAKCGFDQYERTPAQEAYLDGYYSFRPGGTRE